MNLEQKPNWNQGALLQLNEEQSKIKKRSPIKQLKKKKGNASPIDDILKGNTKQQSVLDLSDLEWGVPVRLKKSGRKWDVSGEGGCVVVYINCLDLKCTYW